MWVLLGDQRPQTPVIFTLSNRKLDSCTWWTGICFHRCWVSPAIILGAFAPMPHRLYVTPVTLGPVDHWCRGWGRCHRLQLARSSPSLA